MCPRSLMMQGCMPTMLKRSRQLNLTMSSWPSTCRWKSLSQLHLREMWVQLRSYMLYISFWMEKHSSVLVLWEKTPQCTNWIYWNIRDSFGILLERDRFQEDSDTVFSFISINLICSLWGFLPCFILFFMCRFLSVIVLLMRSLHILFYITENRNRYIETDFSLLLWFLFLD